MRLVIRGTSLHVVNARTRMPFRYGIATLTALPHLFVSVDLEVDGRRQPGIAADGLAPKWFTKDPNTTTREDVAEMLRVIESACAIARDQAEARTVFDLWRGIYAEQMRRAAVAGWPPLLAVFGVSLVERSAIDAFCRAHDAPFAAALRANTLGIRLEELHPELAGRAPADLLPERPLRAVAVRHTVGLTDPLTDDEISPAERLDDGLPQSLQASITTYGLRYLKIKLGGDRAADVARLRRIGEVVGARGGGDLAVTLDGNEQYAAVEPFRALWQSLADEAALAPLLGRLLFVEQPLHRDVALSPAAGVALRTWTDRPYLIVDESDDALDSLPRALDGGYVGTSHKNCKGVFKGIGNACLQEHRRRAHPTVTHVLSGEDLTTIGPVALTQDLAVMASLGIGHVERNGHHYFKGLSMFSEAVQAGVRERHGDLYRRHDRGFATLNILSGAIDLSSVVDAPFGVGFEVDTSEFTPLEGWSFDTLGAS